MSSAIPITSASRSHGDLDVLASGTSPVTHSPLQSHISQSNIAILKPKVLKPFAVTEFKLLLLENISDEAVRTFRRNGFQVDHFTKAWSEDELVAKIGGYHAIGIRSKTKITERVLQAAPRLLVIGCFCIGTNQVDLLAAAHRGIPVFNSPFSNSRSVAELVIAEVISLARQLFDRAGEMRAGTWNKVSKGCWEIRGKTLGIIGYGHIGSQLSVLAEAFGMRVVYHDVLNIMPMGTAQQVDTLEELLAVSDFVTLHVPELPETKGMISTEQLAQMKRGSYLVNNSRGKVVDIPALISALQSKHLAGCSIDVYPAEPGANGQGAFNDQLNSWATTLRSLPNVILTPHIGGSTEEAQRMIGLEVSTALSRYLQYGSTTGSVNLPEVDLRYISAEQENFIRVCFIHRNEPGVLRAVNEILSDHNVEKQFSDSKGDIAYLLADISEVTPEEVQDLQRRLERTRANIVTRLLT